jgi:hypothetical protein
MVFMAREARSSALVSLEKAPSSRPTMVELQERGHWLPGQRFNLGNLFPLTLNLRLMRAVTKELIDAIK